MNLNFRHIEHQQPEQPIKVAERNSFVKNITNLDY
jgi:hypothetical protein